jgi:ATP-dependent DNA ligase
MTSEAKVIANTEGLPETSQSIEEDLISLGIQPGNILLVHSSLSALGWVCGGAPAVIDALLGAYTMGKLRHYGYAGSGFTEKGLKDAVDRMKPLFIDKCPFINPPNIKEKIQWVRPKLVCEVEYAELTADDQLRQTTFLGWRDDKKAQEVVLE